MIETLGLLPIVMLGAIFGLDVVSFPQAMISRPIVAATAAGALMGEPMRGLLIGTALEFFALETLPIGASRYPEWGSAAVVGGALFASQPETLAGALTTATVGALATAWVGSWSMVRLRKLNASWARARHERIARGSKHVVEGLQLYGMTADLARGALLTFVALEILVPLQRAALAHWDSDPRVSRACVVATATAVAGAAAWKVFHATSGARWLFLGGLAAGLSLLALR
jgi:mannose/fructose/N-acetylgalactosamine-specific phosphotransferase system component IIC